MANRSGLEYIYRECNRRVLQGNRGVSAKASTNPNIGGASTKDEFSATNMSAWRHVDVV